MEYDDDTPMPFGAHKGKKLANVPATYLLWCYEQSWCKGHLRTYIQNNLDVLKKEVQDGKN
jgi:uncharacterized protein (DUF3820 family)